MALHRRRLLALLGTGSAGAAGCVDLPGRSGDPQATPTPGSTSAVGCPSYDRRGVDRVVCSTDPPDDALVFEPAPERAQLPRAEIACRLENDSDASFETNFYDWTLHRYDGEDWWWLGPYGAPMPLHRLPPRETHVRRLLVDNTDLERLRPPTPETDDGDHGSGRHGLGPGTYALAITSSSEGPETAYAASFTLRGDPVELVAPEHVRETERDGATVGVHVGSTMDDHDLDRYDLTVRREPDPPREPYPFVDEQLYHFLHAGMRAAFVHFDPDVRAVVVRGDDSQRTRDLAGGRGPDFVEYGGETYALQVDPHDA